jgi:hypothetical protein
MPKRQTARLKQKKVFFFQVVVSFSKSPLQLDLASRTVIYENHFTKDLYVALIPRQPASGQRPSSSQMQVP